MKKGWIITWAPSPCARRWCCVLYKGFGRDPHAVPFMLEGKPAPAFTLRALDSGEQVSLEQLKGRPVVINFWASWCGPCSQEHPVLDWGAREFGSQAQFLGIVFEDTEENARAVLAGAGRQLPPADRSALARVRGLRRVRRAGDVLHRRSDGIILGKHVGPIDPQSLARTASRS